MICFVLYVSIQFFYFLLLTMSLLYFLSPLDERRESGDRVCSKLVSGTVTRKNSPTPITATRALPNYTTLQPGWPYVTPTVWR